ncbi:hypothetical protein NP227_23465, partial [Salmonella enterica]|nr:hypothetical protein [Salmonella enterica]
SLKTSIKTITYLSDIGCLEIQGASLYFVFCDDEYTDIVRILFTGEACCILNKSMLNLRAAGGVLTLEERRAVLNRYYRGLSIAEITEETGQNDKTVYGHLRRALQRSGFRKGRFIKGREVTGDSGVE